MDFINSTSKGLASNKLCDSVFSRGSECAEGSCVAFFVSRVGFVVSLALDVGVWWMFLLGVRWE